MSFNKDKPKKNRNAWTFYCMEMRPKVQKKNPDLNFREVSKKVNEDWKELSEKAQKKWVKEAAEDKKRYEKELKKWQDEQTSESSEEELTRTRYNGRKKPIPKPVGARNVYQFFMMEKKKELKKSNPDMDSKKLTKKFPKPGNLFLRKTRKNLKKWPKKTRKDTKKSGNNTKKINQKVAQKNLPLIKSK